MAAPLEHDKYMYSVDVTPRGRKTRVLEVRSRSSDELLGVIKWWGAWRQYVFCPWDDTVFNVQCLAAVEGVLERLTREQRERRQGIKVVT